MEQPVGQPAYVLHSRAYKETSALVDFFTPQGRVRAVLRRARGKGGSLVRPFVPLEVELRGRSELKNVGRLDSMGIAAWLHGDALFSGLYLNELLMRLLPAEAPFPALSMRPTFFSSPRPRSSTSTGTNGRTRLPPLPRARRSTARMRPCGVKKSTSALVSL